MSEPFGALTAWQQFASGAVGFAPALHLLLGSEDRSGAANLAFTTQLPADGRRGAVDQAGNPSLTEALGRTDLDSGALCNAEFGIGHRGSTVPEWSGVALSFCGRPYYLGSTRWCCLKRRSIFDFWNFRNRAASWFGCWSDTKQPVPDLLLKLLCGLLVIFQPLRSVCLTLADLVALVAVPST